MREIHLAEREYISASLPAYVLWHMGVMVAWVFTVRIFVALVGLMAYGHQTRDPLGLVWDAMALDVGVWAVAMAVWLFGMAGCGRVAL
jgi:hypothetical protein